VDWFQRWPKEALISVADHFLASFNVVSTAEVKKQLVQCMGTLHDDVAETCTSYFAKYRRATHVTPKSYLSFLNGYKTIYSQKHAEIDNLATRMNIGLEKLLSAGESVAELAKELAVKEQELEVANEKADRVLKEVAKKKEAAEKIKAQVQKVKDKAQGIVDEIEKDKAIAETKLEAAKPALLAAQEALNTIKAADIATVRRLGKPPHLIQRIMDCVLLLYKAHLEPITPDPERPCPKPSWTESLRMMAGTNFLGSLLEFKKDIINEETIELMDPYIRMEDYDHPTAVRVCGNVAGLLSWTVAMTNFYAINKEVLPLKVK
jgi:dynein heavy chain